MSDSYVLAPNEAMILQADGIQEGERATFATNELWLTSQNLVIIRKGIFGNHKGTGIYPLNQIKIYEGHAQAQLGKIQNGSPALKIQLLSESIAFGFQSKKLCLQFVNAIDHLVTGSEKLTASTPGSAEDIVETLKDTFDAVKTIFGKPTQSEQPAERRSVSKTTRCSGCGASLSGLQGTTVTCDYCGTKNQL